MDDDGRAKLCGFGLAVLENQSETGATTIAEHLRTEQYREPEHLQSDNNPRPYATFEGDIYSLGCIIFEFVEGDTRFSNEQRDLGDTGAYPASRLNNPSRREAMVWDLLYACWNAEASRRPKINEVVNLLENIVKYSPEQDSRTSPLTASS